jgi:hypothetical protein
MGDQHARIRLWSTKAKVLILVCALLASAVPAQKAEPLRIEFEAGSNVARVHGKLRNRQSVLYALYCGTDKELALKLKAASSTSLAISLQNSLGDDIALSPAGTHRWTARLDQGGDYLIQVRRIRRKHGVSAYDLTLTLNSNVK